nr:TPA_asm: m13.5 sORF 1 [Murid betaherpesvirus 1]DBA07925.1 TPA_asm: m13.5 sORF 1 [Murid betaherpesvirus 1]
MSHSRSRLMLVEM